VDDLPVDSTYVAEWSGVPVVALSFFFTNSRALLLVDNLMSAPSAPHQLRRVAIDQMNGFMDALARQLGYRRILCFTSVPKLVERYQELGFQDSGTDLTSLIKELK
jgi:hypothetical protein